MKTINRLSRLLTRRTPGVLCSLIAITVFMGGLIPAHGGGLPDYCSPKANIIIVLDTSGSMSSDNKWTQAKAAIKHIIERHPTAHYGLVFFSSSGRLGEPLAENNEAEIVATLDRHGPSGMTAMEAGLKVAITEFKAKLDIHPFDKTQSVIVLISDGAANQSNCDRSIPCLAGIARDLRNPGLTVGGQVHSILTFVIGFGSGVDPAALSAIADAGGTNDYAQANNLNELTNALDAIMASIPSEEVCDGYDNDCNGLIDDGLNPPDPSNPAPEFWCNTGMPGQCALGYSWCENGAWSCIPFKLAEEETCNGMDSDCDGFIDATDNSGTGELNPEDSLRNLCGTCGPPPVEICNGLDDDCDGIIDNGAECPEPGEECINGACVQPCAASECPRGLVCRDGFCQELCAGVECQTGFMCDPVSGICFDPCEGITCPDPNTTCIMGACGTCWDLGCPEGQVCVQPGMCKDDPCAGDDVECGFMEACRALPDDTAECVGSCAHIACTGDSTCVDGQCVEDPCATVQCQNWETCLNGTCHPHPCFQATCNEGQICTGVLRNDTTPEAVCMDNPCDAMTCRTGQACEIICVEGDCLGRCVFKDVLENTTNPNQPGDDTGTGPGDWDGTGNGHGNGNGDGTGGWIGGGDAGTDNNQNNYPPGQSGTDDGDGPGQSGGGHTLPGQETASNLGCSCKIGTTGEGAPIRGGWLLILTGLGLAAIIGRRNRTNRG